MKKRILFVLCIVSVHVFQPIIVLAEAYSQEETIGQELVVSEEDGRYSDEENKNEDFKELDIVTIEDDLTPQITQTSEETVVDETIPEVQIEEEQESEQQEINSHSIEKSNQVPWGTVSWDYDVATNTMTLYGGQAGEVVDAPWRNNFPQTTTLVIQGEVLAPTNSHRLFSNTNLVRIVNAERLNMSQVTEMSHMFANSNQLVDVDFANWETGNVQNMDNLFRNSPLTSIDIGNWDLRNVRTMLNMFEGTGSLRTLVLGQYARFSSTVMTSDGPRNWKHVRNMDGSYSMSSFLASTLRGLLTDYDGTNPGTYQVRTDSGTWGSVFWEYYDDSKNIILYGGSAGSVASAPWKTYSSVKQINIVAVVALPGNVPGLFQDLSELETINGGGNLNVSNVRNMSMMFQQANALEELDVSNWNTERVTDMSFMFNQAHSLTSLDVGNWDTSRVTNMRTMFQQTTALEGLDVSNWHTGSVTDMSFMFNQANSLANLNVYNWRTDQVTNMNAMFQHARSLEELNVSNWHTGNVTDMSFMFNQARSLASLDVRNWNTSQVTNMRTMFQQANALEGLDVSNWHTENVTDMSFMFNQAHSLTSLDVSSWETGRVTTLQMMFHNIPELKELDVSSWDTTHVTNMRAVFSRLQSLTYLDVSNWNTERVENMESLFGGTSKLSRIKLGEHSLFDSTVDLPEVVSTDSYTGGWVLEESLTSGGTGVVFESSSVFMRHYDGSNPGTYAWEEVPLVAGIEAVSDQIQEIKGYATEIVDTFVITYQNTAGELITLENADPRIVWEDYQDANQQVRNFRIAMRDNERLETETKVTLMLSKPFADTTFELTEEQIVIKGIDYRANNATLDRHIINELVSEEELHDFILKESRAQAKNVLTEADMTAEFRIVETDLTRSVDEDGSYFALLEVGNKAYRMTIAIDVTTKLEHLRLTIPTRMIFESLYNDEESNRNFKSPDYEIRNQSALVVDTYINQVEVYNRAGIVLLEEGEDPLDYVESEEDDSTHTYEDISTPLLRLNLKTEETEIQLYEAMEDKHLIRLAEKSQSSLSLTGDFYGDYPRWVVDADNLEQGGYYEESLTPKYRIILRFVPR